MSCFTTDVAVCTKKLKKNFFFIFYLIFYFCIVNFYVLFTCIIIFRHLFLILQLMQALKDLSSLQKMENEQDNYGITYGTVA